MPMFSIVRGTDNRETVPEHPTQHGSTLVLCSGAVSVIPPTRGFARCSGLRARGGLVLVEGKMRTARPGPNHAVDGAIGTALEANLRILGAQEKRIAVGHNHLAPERV